MSVKKVTYKLNLNKLGLSNVTAKKEAMKEVGEFLKITILDYVGDIKTPVKGGSYKKSLSPAYKKFKDDMASPVPNMELTGDMLDKLTYTIDTRTGIVEIGIFDSDEAQKADNHNKFSVESLGTDVPARQFIPKNGRDEFRDDIIREVKGIIDDYKSDTDNTSSQIRGLIRSIITE